MSATTRKVFANAQLRACGVQIISLHLEARRFLVAWAHGESGEHPGLCNGLFGQGARWNPQNTTLVLPGSTFYNHITPNLGVQSYRTMADGAAAFAITLKTNSAYHDFLALLQSRDATLSLLAASLNMTPWGTHEPLITESIDAFLLDRSFYNNYPIGS